MVVKLDLARRVTDEELLQLSQRNPGYQFERTAEGRLVVSPTGTEGGRRSMKLAYQLEHWNQQTGRGVTFDASAGFSLPDGSCLSPDASWVLRERWEALPREVREGFAPLCPDAVFEIRSRFNTVAELQEKMHAYLANGARLAVLIDPYVHSVEVHRPGREPERYHRPTHVALDPELPGFVLDLRPLFGD